MFADKGCRRNPCSSLPFQGEAATQAGADCAFSRVQPDSWTIQPGGTLGSERNKTELKHKAIVTKDSGFKIEEVKPLKHFILLNVLQAEKKMLAMFSNGCCGKFFFRAGGGKPKCALHLGFVGEISQLNHNVLLVALSAVACWSCGCKLHSYAYLGKSCFIPSLVSVLFCLFVFIAKASWEWHTASQWGQSDKESDTKMISYMNTSPFLGKNLEQKKKICRLFWSSLGFILLLPYFLQ